MPAPTRAQTVSLETAQRLAKARLKALLKAPYFSHLMHSLSYVSTPGIGTIGIDDRLRLYVDEDALNDWSNDELAVVLMHEVNHVLRGHSARCELLHADAHRWNIAGDAEINDDLVQGGFVLPGEPVLPSSLGLPDNQTAEYYYTNMPRNDEPNQKTCGSGAHGERQPWELGDDISVIPGIPKHRVTGVRNAIAEDIRNGKFRGSVPKNLSRWAESFGRVQVPWEQMLHNAVRRGVLRRMGQVDYTWARPNRRHFGKVLLPSLRRPMCEISIIIDTSGSMNQKDLDAAYTESRGVAEQSSGGRVTLIACDSQAHVISEGRLPRSVALTGGGGTDMGAALNLAAQQRRRPNVVIVLTDGETPWPSHCPDGLLDASVVVAVIREQAGFDMSTVPQWCVGVEIIRN